MPTQAGTEQVPKAAHVLHEAPQPTLKAFIVRMVSLDTDLEAHLPVETEVLPLEWGSSSCEPQSHAHLGAQ